MSQPPWMAEAWAELGIAETAGAANNPRVLALFREAGHPHISTDATAWCAAYVGAILARADLAATGSLMARSYLAWGEPLEAPRLGAIAVFSRGDDPAFGHVGFWLGETDGRVLILGGNQSNAVTVAAFDRARLLGLRWPADAPVPATAAKAPEADPLFARCLAHVLAMEGGYTDDPYDPGGPTNFGITLAVFARHLGATLSDDNRAALVTRLAAIDSATVRAIYRARYWRPSRSAEMPPAVALMHFDATVNHGLLGAARILQSVLGVEVDGEIGPITMAAVRRADPARLVAAYAEARRQRYRALHHFWRFGTGWLNRVAATERLAATPAFTSSPAPPRRTPMTDTTSPQSTEPTASPSKWWGESLTVWGALITAVSTVLPVIGPLVGLDLTPDLVRKLGDQTLVAVQAFGGVVGTLMTILGRARASTPLSRRNMTIQL